MQTDKNSLIKHTFVYTLITFWETLGDTTRDPDWILTHALQYIVHTL